MNRRTFLGFTLAATGGIFVPKHGLWYRQRSLIKMLPPPRLWLALLGPDGKEIVSGGYQRQPMWSNPQRMVVEFSEHTGRAYDVAGYAIVEEGPNGAMLHRGGLSHNARVVEGSSLRLTFGAF